MNTLQKSLLRKTLEEMKVRLEPEVAGLAKEAFRPTAGLGSLGADTQSDPGASAAEEETARTLYGAESGTLAEINAALERFDQGRFGKCESCGDPISNARLKALPYARQCVSCARSVEHSER